jgi:hypothetical protein
MGGGVELWFIVKWVMFRGLTDSVLPSYKLYTKFIIDQLIASSMHDHRLYSTISSNKHTTVSMSKQLARVLLQPLCTTRSL